jgi:peptide/nickel transport system permease protein
VIQYIIRRLVVALPAIILVALFANGVVHLVPGDAVLLMIQDTGYANEEQLAHIRHELGLDQPFLSQFVSWLGGVVRGDFGKSIWTGRPVLGEILRTLPLTLELAFLAMGAATLLAIPIGVISAIRQNTIWDYALRLVAIFGLSVPGFVMAIGLILILSLTVGWVPPMEYANPLENPVANLKQMVLPAFSIGFIYAAVIMRMTRSSMLEVMRQDYIRTAWSKGLPEFRVVLRHALKNAFIPIIAIMGIRMRALLGSTVIIETVFALPGIGRLTLDALLNRDFTQLQGNLLVIALLIVVINLLVDLSYAWFNPRIRYS